jgi:hypothetical protein
MDNLSNGCGQIVLDVVNPGQPTVRPLGMSVFGQRKADLHDRDWAQSCPSVKDKCGRRVADQLLDSIWANRFVTH